MEEYALTALKKEFHIDRIATIHYFEYEKNYSFIGETHDFWELVYVDKGEIEVNMEGVWSPLKQGEVVFHQPNEYHNLRTNGVVAPNIIIVTFACKSRGMKFFQRKFFTLSDAEKHLLAVIIKEARRAFSSPLDDTFLKKLERSKYAEFGAEQMILISLEQLLIMLRRNHSVAAQPNSTVQKRRMEDDAVSNVITFLSENIGSRLNFTQIAEYAGLGATNLKMIFKNRTGQSVMAYFAGMKIDRAKTLIREGNYNITQISALLGYDSIHLFSRRFKQITGMSPTEYGKSVKVEFEE